NQQLGKTRRLSGRIPRAIDLDCGTERASTRGARPPKGNPVFLFRRVACQILPRPAQGHMPKTILIVDDNELLRMSLSFVLTSKLDGISVVEVENAAHAIDRARADPPDLIVLDIAMPGMNGLVAAPILKKLAPKASILLFTLYAAEVQAPYHFGVDAIVSKAQGADTFLNTVRELLASAKPAELPRPCEQFAPNSAT